MKQKKLIRVMVSVFILWGLVFFTQVAYASGINLIFGADSVKDHNGASIDTSTLHFYPSKTVLEFFYNNPPSDPTKTENLYGGTTTNTSGGKYYYYYSTLNGGTFYVRAWDGPRNTRGSYYGKTQGNPTVGNAVPADWDIDLTTRYIADTPPSPTVTPGSPAYGEVLKDGKRVLVPYVSITIANSNTTNYEITKYHLRVWNKAAPTEVVVDAEITTTSNSTTYTINTSNFPQLKFGTTYSAAATASNWFGDSAYSTPPVDFSTVNLDDVALPLTALLIFESQVPDKPGINFFSMPFAGPWYAISGRRADMEEEPITWWNNREASTNEVRTAYDLVMAVNSAAGDLRVISTFGSWESSTQKGGGVLLVENNPTTKKTELDSIALRQGIGYQVYVGKVNGTGANPSSPIRVKISNKSL